MLKKEIHPDIGIQKDDLIVCQDIDVHSTWAIDKVRTFMVAFDVILTT